MGHPPAGAAATVWARWGPCLCSFMQSRRGNSFFCRGCTFPPCGRAVGAWHVTEHVILGGTFRCKVDVERRGRTRLLLVSRLLLPLSFPRAGVNVSFIFVFFKNLFFLCSNVFPCHLSGWIVVGGGRLLEFRVAVQRPLCWVGLGWMKGSPPPRHHVLGLFW